MNFADGQLDKLSIRNSGTGLLLTYGDGGIAVSRANIEVDKECIDVADSFASVVTFLDSKFSSEVGSLVRIAKNSGAILSMQRCEFGKWSQQKAAIELNGGAITLHDNIFTGGGTSVKIGEGARGASISRNSYATSFEQAIDGMKKGEMFAFEDSKPDNASVYPNYDLKLTDPITPVRREMFDIRSFGGNAAEGFDNTTAISEALNAAKIAGGGVVFVPAGNYLVNGTLTVPENVELRGISESIHHTSGGGSVLMTTAGEENSSAAPFISLERRSALRGITIWYPNQPYWKIQPYPWAIRVLGQDVSVRFLTLGNAFKGVDMAAGDAGGHYIEGLAGMTFSQVLQLDGSTKAGVIKNVHFNPHFLIESRGTNLPGNGDDVNARNVSHKIFSEIVFKMQDQHNIPFTIGKVTDETIFSIFNYRSSIGMRLTGGFDGILHSVGLDGTISDMEISGEQPHPILLMNCVLDLVPGSTTKGNGHLFINTKNHAKVYILNGKFGAWNYVHPQGIETAEGKVSIWSSYFTVTPTDGAVRAINGDAELRGCVFGHLDILTGNDGTTDAVGFYTYQPRDVKDVIVSGSSQVMSIGSIGVNSLNLVGSSDALRGNNNIVIERP